MQFSVIFRTPFFGGVKACLFEGDRVSVFKALPIEQKEHYVMKRENMEV